MFVRGDANTPNIFDCPTRSQDTVFYGLGYLGNEIANFQSKSVPLPLMRYINEFDNDGNYCEDYDENELGRLINPFNDDRLKIYAKMKKLNGKSVLIYFSKFVYFLLLIS